MKNKTKRYLWSMLGILINSFGVALITKAALGTSPISSLPYVLSLRFAPTLGAFTYVMNLVFIVVQPRSVWVSQLAVNIVFSWAIDLSMALLGGLAPQGLLLQLVTLVLGCAVLGLGISIEVAPAVLLVPGEGVVGLLADRLHRPFGRVKVAFDVTLVSIALVLSVCFFRGIRGVGLGTVLSALLVGRFVGLSRRHLPLIGRLTALAAADD
ncbi:MAG: DUF6198 family protein [Eubacteriales bacterium]|nr:DUF6198 family protein [Eubacteriales bacterium]